MKDDHFDEEVKHILTKLASLSPDSEEYTKTVNNLSRLCEARSLKTNRTISLDTIINGAVNLLGILLILNHERLNVITSKSIAFIPKVRS
jgi:hypothetical protein